MSTDRELLEWAAKAAGYARMKYFDDTPYVSGDMNGDDFLPWNPLTDDGDALRLAVKLCMSVTNTTIRTSVFARHEPEFGDWIGTSEPHKGDPCAATRLAIVRVAAEIGKHSAPKEES